jgi:predicted nucleotidyltransferase
VERAARLLKERFPADAVILFGSKARGDDDPETDIDLLVLTSRPVDFAEKRRMTDALFDIEPELAVVISKLVVPREEWEHGLYQVLPIREHVEREGAAA